jgi:glycosyltransferase involved in cell wall biosynthesis
MPGRSVKVGIYVSELDVKGGTHKQVLRLAQHLLARQHQVQIITPRYVPGQGYPEFAALSVLTLPAHTGGGFLGKLQRRLRPVRLAMQMDQVDVVNVHDNRGLMFGFLAKWFGKGRRYVWQINDLDPAFKLGAHREHQRPTAREVQQRLVNRWWAQSVDAITVNVGKNRERVKECLSRDAEVLFCGVDFPASDFHAQTAPGAFKLLTTGVFFPYRNYETLLQACAIANKSLATPIELTIVGDTRYNPEYAARVRQLAQTSGVALTIRENLSQADLDHQIEHSHAFAFVNVDQSWGLSVFEAAARSTPVILSRSVGASELLGSKPGFLMVDPLSAKDIASAILSLATDGARLLATATQARDTVKDMSWERLYCAPAVALFERLLKA